MKKTFVIADPQFAQHSTFDVIRASANYIVKEMPEEIVLIGDWFDFESLSFFASPIEKENRRLADDFDVGIRALQHLMEPLRQLQERQRINKKKVYRPKIVFCAGNHEERLARYMSKCPELEGMVPDVQDIIESFGIEYYPFLKPYVGIHGVHYFHFLANPMSGKPVGGSMENKLNKVTYSFVQGHIQIYQYAERQQATGNPQFGIVAGAFYDHDEDYKGYQGNTHSRGTPILHHHEKGTDVEYMSTTRIKEVYGVL